MATTAEATGSIQDRYAAHTRKVHLRDRIAKGVLWGAAGITMTMLVLIVGFIIVNGFYTRSTVDSPVLPYVEESVALSETDRFAVATHRSLRLRDLTYDELREIYLGLNSYWGYQTGQNRTVRAIVADDPQFSALAAEYLSLGENGFPDSVVRVGSRSQARSALDEDRGAIALVPASWVAGERGLNLVGVRQVSVVVHPGVLALQAGRRLDTLTAGQVEDLLDGSAETWADVGGPSIEIEAADPARGDPGVYEPLPVVPFQLASSVPAHRRPAADAFVDLSPAATTRTAASVEDLLTAVAETPGSVGIVRRRAALEAGADVVRVDRTTHSLNLRPSFIVSAPSRAGAVGGISYIIINTLVMVAMVLLIATPIGVAAAVYLVEYAKQGKLVQILRIGTDTLAGIPSIIFGLFGMVFFSQFLRLQTGLLAGALTLTIMILPTVVRTSEEALKSVPNSLREGSLALGVTKLQTIFFTVIPAASSGILTGLILGIGRAIGETAAILFTLGSNLAMIRSLNSPMRVLSVHLYMLVRENISLPNAFATATILVAIVFLVNYATRRLITRSSGLS